MQLLAQRVLDDCEIALRLIENEDDGDTWRVLWAGAVALLRAVGHVLHKVDAVQHPEMRSRIEYHFRTWKSDDPDHQIFREFIDQERNSILKNYASTAHQGGIIPILLEHFPMKGGADAQQKFESLEWLSEDIYRPRVHGYRAGDDMRDIYRDAINWWRTELSKVIAD